MLERVGAHDPAVLIIAHVQRPLVPCLQGILASRA
jgi:hypothetical protein